MRKILQHIAGMDLSIPSQGFGGWTDFRMVERGFGYVKKVKELAATDDFLAGVVDGTARYFTNVRIAENGELEAFCSCPVGKRCKHAVALILKTWRMVKSQEEIPSTIAEEWMKAVERKQEEKQYYQRLAVEHREAQRVYEEKCEQECEDAFWQDFNAVREAVLASCREDSVEKIKAAVVTFLEWTDDEELYRHPRLCREVGGAVSPTMAAVFETFEANDVDAADMIVWSYEFDWKPVPKPVVYQIKTTCPETPPWPLPWANEGVRRRGGLLSSVRRTASRTWWRGLRMTMCGSRRNIWRLFLIRQNN